jgi:hypothetical protein
VHVCVCMCVWCACVFAHMHVTLIQIAIVRGVPSSYDWGLMVTNYSLVWLLLI